VVIVFIVAVVVVVTVVDVVVVICLLVFSSTYRFTLQHICCLPESLNDYWFGWLWYLLQTSQPSATHNTDKFHGCTMWWEIANHVDFGMQLCWSNVEFSLQKYRPTYRMSQLTEVQQNCYDQTPLTDSSYLFPNLSISTFIFLWPCLAIAS
jgi:hypothetical protein